MNIFQFITIICAGILLTTALGVLIGIIVGSAMLLAVVYVRRK